MCRLAKALLNDAAASSVMTASRPMAGGCFGRTWCNQSPRPRGDGCGRRRCKSDIACQCQPKIWPWCAKASQLSPRRMALPAAGASRHSPAAKTGTAEVGSRSNRHKNAWVVCYGPLPVPRFALACIIEEGDTGGRTAVPIAAQFLRLWQSRGGDIAGVSSQVGATTPAP